MNKQKHIIIYSHGFGVRRDDLGLLTDIAAHLPEAEHVLFDYYPVDEKENKIYLCPISDQVSHLRRVVSLVRESNPEAVIDLVAHSQGTIVAALAGLAGIRCALLLAPTFDMSLERTLSRYRSKPEAKIDLDGISEIPATVGPLKVIPAEYWRERAAIEPFSAYSHMAELSEVLAVEAAEDQFLAPVDPVLLDKKIKLVTIDGDHNFNPPHRQNLIALVRKFLLNTELKK